MGNFSAKKYEIIPRSKRSRANASYRNLIASKIRHDTHLYQDVIHAHTTKSTGTWVMKKQIPLKQNLKMNYLSKFTPRL